MGKVVAITGASDGIGLACAEKFACEGWVVYDLSRHGCGNDSIRHITTDVTDKAAVNAAFKQIEAECGGLDLLIANAGFGISGASEFTDPEQISKLFAVNFTGAASCVRAAVPLLRRTHGRIIFTSSVAAITPIPYQSFYSATKSAINTYACALANELRPFGIKIVTLMLGDAKTGFTSKREKEITGDDIYGGRIARSVAQMEKDEQGGMSPAVIAKAYFRAANRPNPKPLYAVGAQYKLFAVLAKLLPIRAVNAILYMMYGK